MRRLAAHQAGQLHPRSFALINLLFQLVARGFSREGCAAAQHDGVNIFYIYIYCYFTCTIVVPFQGLVDSVGGMELLEHQTLAVAGFKVETTRGAVVTTSCSGQWLSSVCQVFVQCLV